MEKSGIRAQNRMLSSLPIRCIQDFLLGTKIYYDCGEFESQIDGAPVIENERAGRTPWVLTLKLDFEKLIRGSMLNTVIEKLREKYQK